LLVGPDEQAMVVHEDCLSRDSRFFRAALKKEWRKGRIIELPEETPFHMGYYIEHLNGFDLPTRKLATGPPNQDREQFPYELLATLYVLGERMLDSEYRNKISSSGSSTSTTSTTTSILGRALDRSTSSTREQLQNLPLVV
jgi:hypothetical protein